MRCTSNVAVVGLALTSLALTAACGGSSSPTTVTLISPGVPATTPLSSAANSPTSTGTSATSQNVAGTIDFTFSSGDKVELTFRIDKPVDMAAADVMAQSCRLDNDPSRALVQHFVVTATLTSTLAQKFTLKFGQPMLVPLAAQFAAGGQCLNPGYDSGLALTLTPGQSDTQDLWMIGDGAKTPVNPAGDPTILSWMTFNPSMHVGWTLGSPDAMISAAFGDRVRVCNMQHSADPVMAEVFADPAAFAKGDQSCAPAATRADFAALEAKAGTVQDSPTASP